MGGKVCGWVWEENGKARRLRRDMRVWDRSSAMTSNIQFKLLNTWGGVRYLPPPLHHPPNPTRINEGVPEIRIEMSAFSEALFFLLV